MVGLLRAYGLPASALWSVMPAPEYADLPLDGYNTQPYFHQINTKSPGLQLVMAEPYVIR